MTKKIPTLTFLFLGILKCDLETEFDCGEGKQCIPIEFVCDTKNDCGGFEDEPRERCGGEGKCGVENGGCDQKCVDTPQGHVCSCFSGFIMGINNTCQGITKTHFKSIFYNFKNIYADCRIISCFCLN